MILHLDPSISDAELLEMNQKYYAVTLKKDTELVVVTASKVQEVDEKFKPYIKEQFVFADDIQLASRKYRRQTRKVELPNGTIGGDTNNTTLIIGPCSVESEQQIEESAKFIQSIGLKSLRAGSFKPRTSPYSFQGMGREGLLLLAKMRDKYGFTIVSEVRDSTHIEDVIELSDVIQIGAKSMYDHGILRRCGKTQKPVLLKRGFGTTLQEFVQAAEFILSGGNENVVLCERGIRTFESKTRFTLDLCGVAYLKEYTNLPIILDPSHAMGYSYGVADLAKACMAMGVDGLLIEVHPNPKVALSDASQQLDHKSFSELLPALQSIAHAVGKNII